MALPTSRNTNYTPATPAKSNDLNDIQDAIVGSKHGERWQWYNLVDSFLVSGADATARGNGYLTAAGAGSFLRSIPVYEGQRIKSAAFRFRNINAGGGQFMRATFLCYDNFTNIDDTEIEFEDNVAAAEQAQTAATSVYTIGPGYNVFVQIDLSDATQRAYSVGLLVDCP